MVESFARKIKKNQMVDNFAEKIEKKGDFFKNKLKEN